MATPAMTPLANITLGSAQASVTFSNISQNYRDLVLVFSGTTSVAQGSIIYQINNDATARYVYNQMQGTGTAAGSQTGTYFGGAIAGWGFAVALGNLAQSVTHFMDYSAIDKQKTILTRADVSTTFTEASVVRWPDNAPINAIKIFNNGSTGLLAAGSTVSLYGVLA